MAKKRLTVGVRKEILREVQRGLDLGKIQRDAERKTAKAIKSITAAVERKFPVADMDILAKYDQVRRDKCGALVSPSGQIVGFDFEWSFPSELLPESHRLPRVPAGRCNIRNLAAKAAEVSALENMIQAVEKYQGARKSLIRDFNSVIVSARYVEDLIGVLPLKDGFFDRFRRPVTAVTVSGETLSRVRSAKIILEDAAAA